MDTEQEVVAKVSRAEWIAIAALSVTIVAQIFNMGVVYGQVQDHEREIAALKTVTDTLVPRVERIDANVEFLTSLAKEERERRRVQ
jgi:uncharacterized membrane protein YoaK (UPF0700 family)